VPSPLDTLPLASGFKLAADARLSDYSAPDGRPNIRFSPPAKIGGGRKTPGRVLRFSTAPLRRPTGCSLRWLRSARSPAAPRRGCPVTIPSPPTEVAFTPRPSVTKSRHAGIRVSWLRPGRYPTGWPRGVPAMTVS